MPTVSLKLTQIEHELLQELAVKQHARSLSQCIRSCIAIASEHFKPKQSTTYELERQRKRHTPRRSKYGDHFVRGSRPPHLA
jgi:hypothetical protein